MLSGLELHYLCNILLSYPIQLKVAFDISVVVWQLSFLTQENIFDLSNDQNSALPRL